MGVSLLLVERVFGYGFLGALTYLLFIKPEAYPLPVLHWYTFLASLLTDNILLIILINIGQICWILSWLPGIMLYCTRLTLAWAFDRIAPEPLGYVSLRFHTPTISTIVAAIGGIVCLFLGAFVPGFATLVGCLGLALALDVVALTGILWPFVNKEMFERSPAAKYKIGKVPAISIIGTLAFLTTAFVTYLFLIDDIQGANTPLNLSVVFGTFIFALIIYYAMRAYRKRQGIDIDLAFKEIPPE